MKKYMFFFCLIAFWPALAFAQQVNPVITHQNDDIIIQDTDVYYSPYLPPAPTDNRGQLSCIAYELRDVNGPRDEFDYLPMTHGVPLSNYIGEHAMWQRLFTAMNKPDGSPSDIIVGDSVTSAVAPTQRVVVDSLEDVDFRATGTIKMENGFHVMPGAFFHAYIAPNWGSGTCATAGDSGNALVFCDEFADSALAQWHAFASKMGGPECAYDTNVHATVTDTDAEDNAALQFDMRIDTCSCNETYFNTPDTVHPGCSEYNTTSPPTVDALDFATGGTISCPWPFKNDTFPLQPAYQHMPYGRWEVREKVPHVFQHTNNWGTSQGFEWNLDETTDTGNFSLIRPYLSHPYIYGPYQGIFSHDTQGLLFRSGTARFSWWNNPRLIIIGGFSYECNLNLSSSDTVLRFPISGPGTTGSEGGVPSSFADSTGNITFYYTRYGGNTSDSTHWWVSSDGKYFHGAYGDSNGHSLYFSKSYQPTSIGLNYPDTTGTLGAIWNSDSGAVLLIPPLDSARPHSGFSQFFYSVDEGPGYPIPTFQMDTNGYKYHTYAMEFLPHECEFLVDDAVILRFPDRMVPPGDIRYDYVTSYPRTPLPIIPGELEQQSTSFAETYFRNNVGSCLGCWDNAAHLRIDYVKVWDIPKDVIIPPFPQ